MKHKVVVAMFENAHGGPRAFGGHYADPDNEGMTLCGFPIVNKKSAHEHVKCSLCYTLTGGKVRPRKGAPPGAA